MSEFSDQAEHRVRRLKAGEHAVRRLARDQDARPQARRRKSLHAKRTRRSSAGFLVHVPAPRAARRSASGSSARSWIARPRMAWW